MECPDPLRPWAQGVRGTVARLPKGTSGDGVAEREVSARIVSLPRRVTAGGRFEGGR